MYGTPFIYEKVVLDLCGNSFARYGNVHLAQESGRNIRFEFYLIRDSLGTAPKERRIEEQNSPEDARIPSGSRIREHRLSQIEYKK